MPIIKAFRGCFFDTDSVELVDVIAPSYHEISCEKYSHITQRDEHNIAHVLCGFEQGWYAQSGRRWKSWRENTIVSQDTKDAIYVLHQQFKFQGELFLRRGFIALCKITDQSNSLIYPHYETHLQQREDRLRLLEATHAHFDQITCCYHDEKHSLDSLLRLSTQTNPSIQFSLNGIEHTLWKVTTPATIEHAVHILAHEKVFIATGQHRIDAANRLRQQLISALHPAGFHDALEYIPAFFCNVDEPGTFVQSIFRAITPNKGYAREDILTKLHKYFNLNQYNREEGLRRLREAKKHAFLFAFPGIQTCTLARLKSDELLPTLLDTTENEILRSFDMTLLNNFILEKVFEISKEDQLYADRIYYSHDETEIYAKVQQNAIGIFLNPPSLPEISNAAFNDVILPFNSTYFYPSIPSGMIMHTLELK